MRRLIRTSSHAYPHNHLFDIFGHSYAISRLAQSTTGGFFRSDQQREVIANHFISRK